MIYISIITGVLFLVIGLLAMASYRRGYTSRYNSMPVIVICSIAAILCVGFAVWSAQLKKDSDASDKLAKAKEQTRKQMEGLPAPDFEGVTAQGDTVRLSDFTCKGKFVLLDLWASWCGPCKRYLPVIRDFGKKYPELEVIGVDVNDNMEDALKCISDENMT